MEFQMSTTILDIKSQMFTKYLVLNLRCHQPNTLYNIPDVNDI